MEFINFITNDVIKEYKWDVILPAFSVILSIVFVIVFFFRRKKISEFEINKTNLEKYVGKASYFYKTYCKKDGNNDIERLKRGLSKNLRLRDCGSKPADNAVQISKLLPRSKFSGSRNHAKPPLR